MSGDQAQYILDQEVIVLRGRDLRFASRNGSDTITARDSLEYWRDREIAVARGNAQAVHEDKQINADILVAHFQATEGDKQDVSQVDAEGIVRGIGAALGQAHRAVDSLRSILRQF